MRIAIIVPHFYPAMGGHEYYLARELVRDGQEVRVITSDFLPTRYFRKPTRRHNGGSEFGDIEVRQLKSFYDLHGMPIFDPRDEISAFAPDVVLATEFYQLSSFRALSAAKESGSGFIFAQHMYEPPGSLWGLLWRGIAATYGSSVIHGADHAAPISNAAGRMLQSMGVPASKMTVIPLGVDSEEFQQDRSREEAQESIGVSGEPAFLFVGRLEGVKGVRFLIPAYARALAVLPDSALLIRGDGVLRGELEAAASRLGIGEHVKFLPSLAREKVPTLYAASDVFVLPSLKEPFGLVALEAMSMGVPTVASRVGGLPDFVIPDSTGILVEPGDIASLADALIRMGKDEQFRVQMGRNSRRLVESEFSYRIVAKKTMAMFQAVLGAASKPPLRLPAS